MKELSGTKKSPEQLAKLLLTHAFEVEGIEAFPHGLNNVIIGKVAKLEKHPNADKLRVARVECGKKEVYTIVCGAPNVAEGQRVVVALPGAKLPGGIDIKETEIRGVRSAGMICSARELGLGDDHQGILVLPEDVSIGILFAEYAGLEDSLIEVKILPDRGSDALSCQGLAREIAALDGRTPQFAEPKKKSLVPLRNRAPRAVIADKRGCFRYLGLSLRNITVTESPLWLKARLIVSGLRPVNNIVDITNYLMLLTGQPMHAFDEDKISGAITIRRAKKNEKITLLNGEKKRLSPEDLVIADNKKALALAGVMGGADSAIDPKTKNIFLEIATFDGPTIRRTKTRHTLPTDASYRFERGLDPNLPGETAREAASLITSFASGTLVGMRDAYPKPIKPWTIALSIERVENVLGTKFPLFEAVQHLALLGLRVRKVSGEKSLLVTVPTRRPDLRDEWNLIEEIGRMRGYETIVPVAPTLSLVAALPTPEKRFRRLAKEYLAATGFDELITYSFYGEKDCSAARLPRENHLELANPMNPEQALLRLSLLPTLLRKVRENLRHTDTLGAFEWENVFFRDAKKDIPKEEEKLALAFVAPKKNVAEAFFVLKGKLEALFETFHIGDIAYEPLAKAETSGIAATPMFHPTRSTIVSAKGRTLGIVGELHPLLARAFDFDNRAVFAEFDTRALLAARTETVVYEAPQRFPYVLRDISLSFPHRISVGDVEKLLRDAGAPLLRRFELFDIYEQGEGKSLAFHLYFGLPDRTLSGDEADQAFQNIVESAKERFSARLKD